MIALPFRWTLVLLIAGQCGESFTIKAPLIASEQPQVQATCGGVPVKRFGFCWVLGEAPDLLDDATLQVGNTVPRVKVHPKDSSQIKRNYLGVTTTRMPRSTLGWTPIQDAVEVGRGMPATITIKLSRDNREWETVYDGPTDDSPEKLDAEFRFAGRPAKQIWITAGKLPLVENILYAFSLAEVAVYDTSGENVALATRGTGVTVNSTHHGPGQVLAAHRWYWPLIIRLEPEPK